MAAKKRPKKRTRRAVAARRSDSENEQAAQKLRDEWWTRLRLAMRNVEFYDRRLAYYSRKRAAIQADALFTDVD